MYSVLAVIAILSSSEVSKEIGLLVKILGVFGESISLYICWSRAYSL